MALTTSNYQLLILLKQMRSQPGRDSDDFLGEILREALEKEKQTDKDLIEREKGEKENEPKHRKKRKNI